MRTYSFYIQDRRYSVPTLKIATVGDEIDARDLARKHLEDGDHHLAVEVLEGQTELFRLEREAV